MDAQPIVIKRVIRPQGHHGGAWKVAFADFATAMMAFFLLLWIMASTNEEQKGAISEYFNNPSAVPGASVLPPPGASAGDGGASDTVIDLGGGMPLPSSGQAENPRGDLAALREELENALRDRESLAEYADHLLIDTTPEGLRIQIIDQERRSMFQLGSASLQPFASMLIGEIGHTLNRANTLVSVSGHTDALPLNRPDYSNWELSVDRANAARRALIDGGLREERFGRLVGLGATVPLLEDDPAHPVNRRISILVMSEDAIESMRAAAQGLVSQE